MRAIAIPPTEIESHRADLTGAIITRDLHLVGARFRKGQIITGADLPALATSDLPIHAVILDDNEVHENDAAIRLAALLRHPDHTTQRDPVQSRVNIRASTKGLLRVDSDTLFRLNANPEIGIFTLPDGMVVVPGTAVAGVKISPVAIARETLNDAEFILQTHPTRVIDVRPFRPHRVGVIVAESHPEQTRARFESTVRHKIAWYGSTLLGISEVPPRQSTISAAVRAYLHKGAQLILIAGSHMMDPLDPVRLALPEVGATLTRLGAPAHPGSMFWLAHIDDADVPVVSLASCSMFSRSTVADLILPRIMAGERVTSDDLARLGHGGLLDRAMQWRFPPYDVEASEEPGDIS